MLEYKLLKNHAGLLLIGDYGSLYKLRDVVLDVNERSSLIRDHEGVFLGLAYDVRKAYERQRQIIKPPAHDKVVGTRYGVEILWPVLMLQQRILRTSLEQIEATKYEQAMTYALEAVMEDALDEDFGSHSAAIRTAWQQIDPTHPWAEEKLDSRGALFCSWSGIERKEKLGQLLDSLDHNYPNRYETTIKHTVDHAWLAPDALDTWENIEWSDPDW